MMPRARDQSDRRESSRREERTGAADLCAGLVFEERIRVIVSDDGPGG
jgi:hypothetical protein